MVTLNPKNSIKMLQLAGATLTVGQQHGESCRREISEFVDVLLSNVTARAVAKVSLLDLQAIAEKNLAFCREYDADIVEEMEGIAQGANEPIWKIALLNSFLELLDLRDQRNFFSLVGCTSFAANHEATSNAATYLGQNYEMEAFYKKFRLVMELNKPNVPKCIVYSYTGVVGCAGFNDIGIGVVINFLHPRHATSGVIYPVILRKILSQPRIGDAVGAATIGKRAGGTNFLIADATGLIFDVETAPKQHDILVPTNGTFAHANHYVSPVLHELDLLLWDTTYNSSVERRGSSFIRHHLFNYWLQQNRGHITQDMLFSFCSDHTNYPYSVCCHGSSDDSDLIRGETNASLLFNLTRREFWICPGTPCQCPPSRYVLSI